jgi:hypothetical protein
MTARSLLIDSDVLIDLLRKISVGIGDALIAGTAKEMKMVLVTRNIKHYPTEILVSDKTILTE